MKRLKRLLVASIMLLCAGHVFALEDYVSDVYHEIDTAFQQKSETGLNVVLQENQGDKYYYLMENYATKKVRRLIITNDYEFAMNAILVIIDNNIIFIKVGRINNRVTVPSMFPRNPFMLFCFSY